MRSSSITREAIRRGRVTNGRKSLLSGRHLIQRAQPLLF